MKPAIVKSLSETKIEVVRKFDSPVECVWKTFTDANLVRQWMLGPPGWSMPVCKIDFRIDGNYENVFRNEAEGTEITIAGTFGATFYQMVNFTLWLFDRPNDHIAAISDKASVLCRQ